MLNRVARNYPIGAVTSAQRADVISLNDAQSFDELFSGRVRHSAGGIAYSRFNADDQAAQFFVGHGVQRT